jgi:hypothetical protein
MFSAGISKMWRSKFIVFISRAAGGLPPRRGARSPILIFSHIGSSSGPGQPIKQKVKKTKDARQKTEDGRRKTED